MKKLATIAGIFLLVASAAALGATHATHSFGLFHRFEHAGVEPQGPGFPGPDIIEHLTHMLNLTDDQKAQAKSILDAEMPRIDAIHAKLDDLHKQMEAATANGQFDETTVRSIATQQAQLEADQTVEHERMKATFYKLLTPEQRTKMDAMHSHMGHMGHPGGPGGPGGPPPAPAD